VILDDPLLIGERDKMIGEVITDSVAASVMVSLPIVGSQTVTGSADSTVTYVEFLPVFETGIGEMTDVLHLTIEITGTLNYSLGVVDIPDIESEFYLKEGIGMVAHDQNADLDDAEIKVLDRMEVAGSDDTGEETGIEPPFITQTDDGIMLTVSWDTVDDATGYTLFYAPVDDISIIYEMPMGTDTRISLPLWSGLDYYVAVKAYNDTEISEYSNILIVP
jgi:hypothetical protein